MTHWILPAILALTSMAAATVWAQAPDPIQPAHESLEPGARTDDLGITVPRAPASHPGRRYPASHEFPSGPEIGERLPGFSLPNQTGQFIDYHADRGDSKSIVVFFRSAVW